MRDTKIGLGPEDRTQRDLRDLGTLETQAADSRLAGIAGGPQRGDQIGRFVVLGVLGAGGMGVVYSAYDPHLDRKVAIKLLTAEAASAGAQTRLLREAQAMAKIHHPNVIVVHEVGTLGEQVYLAMEFADGGTLREWCTVARREQREILAVFVQAGRGLVAAHAAGLVHRDFKPDNVLLSSDGTARVTDFGLVGMTNADTSGQESVHPPVPSPDPLGASGQTPLTTDLTETGAIMGTPRYMAPEQFRGAPSTERTDQFAFCIALYEALYGERPFAGTSYAELCANVCTGALLPPPKGSSVPGWLRKVLVRGLSLEPASRHPSMKELLAALAHDRRRIRTALVAGGAAALVAGGAAVALAMHPSRGSGCAAGGEHVHRVWNPQRKATLHDAFARSQRVLAQPIFDRTVALIDKWTGEWQDGYVGACEATRAHGEQSEHLLDLRMQCLQQRLDATSATIEAAMAGDADTVDHALEAFSALPSVAACADTAALLAAVSPPERAETARQVKAVRDQLAHAYAEELLGKFKAALDHMTPVLEAARATGYGAVIAEAELAVGRLEDQLGEKGAADMLRDAMHTALQAGDTTTMLDASAHLVFTLSTNQTQLDGAQEVAGFADAAATRAHAPLEIYVRLQDSIALLDATRGRMDAAQARYEKTLALAEDKLGADDPGTLTTLDELATIYRHRGRFDDAHKAYERVLASREQVMGKDHPAVAAALGNLGIVLVQQGKFDVANKAYDRALAIDRAAYGETHSEVASILNNIGSAASEQGDLPKALDYYQQALAIREKVHGKDSVLLVGSLLNIGGVLNALDKTDEARGYLERALALNEAHGNRDGHEEADILNNLSLVAQGQDRLADAHEMLERARAIYESIGGVENPDAIETALNEANLMSAEGKHEEAEALALRELPRAEKAFGADHLRVGMLLINLGSYQRKLGKHQEGLRTFERALSIVEKAFGEDHLYTAYALAGVGEELLALHEPAKARPYLQRAVASPATPDMDPRDLAELRAALATSHR